MIEVSSSVSSHVATLKDRSPMLVGKVEVPCQEYLDLLSKSTLKFTHTRIINGTVLVYYTGGYDQIYGSEDDLKKIVALLDTRR